MTSPLYENIKNDILLVYLVFIDSLMQWCHCFTLLRLQGFETESCSWERGECKACCSFYTISSHIVLKLAIWLDH